MKTIAISIDEAALEAVDRLVRRRRASRSEVVRRAIREYVDRQERREREERERRIFAAHRERVARQAEALVAEQAEP